MPPVFVELSVYSNIYESPDYAVAIDSINHTLTLTLPD